MRIIIFISGILIPLSLFAQESQDDTSLLRIWESGLPYIAQYTPDDYKSAAQNWSVTQDDNGIIYVGNSGGILEFDGISWRQIPFPNSARVTSFARGENGTIYTGGSRDFGYLSPDSLGQMQFHSFLPQIDTTYHDFSTVWHTYAVQDTIYFITEKYIFRQTNNTFKVILPNGIFGFGFFVEDNIFVDDRGTGIMQVTGDSLSLIPDGEMFSAGGITAMSPLGQDEILMIHALDGFYLYDQNNIVPINNEWIENITTYGSIILPGGDLLIYTIGNGAYIFDAGGNLKQILNKNRGLTSDVVYGAFIDREGGLWLANDYGINRIEISSPIRLFNDLTGLDRSAQNVLSTQNGIYASTNDGLFYFTNDQLGFERVPDIGNMTRNLIPIGDGVLAGNLDALYLVDKQNQPHVIKFGGDSYNILLKSSIDTATVYVAGNSGNLYELTLSGENLKLGESILGIDGSIMQIVEDPDSSLWLNTRHNGIYNVDRVPGTSESTSTEDFRILHFVEQDGLPALSNNYLYQADDQLYASTQAGVYRFDSTHQYFEPDSSLMNQINVREVSTGPVESSGDEQWIAVKSEFQNKVYFSKNSLVTEVIPSRRFSDWELYNIYNSSTGIIFFSGPKGIIAYNTLIELRNKMSIQTQIRHVFLNSDSLIFAGHSRKEKTEMELPFENRSIRFAYALPAYDKPEANQYQYFLEGFDESWSDWTTETQRDLTNLPEGDYHFRVRGQNVYGEISEEASYTFTLLPPWYRTWWAYLFYGLALLGLVGFIVRWRSEQLRREKKVLEHIVIERTDEIRQKNEQLKKQAEKLQEMDYQKSRFFANISHEFRTPLTLIKGPVKNIKEHPEETLSLEHIEMIDRNADRLLRLVNQLLDLSKLDAKTQHPEPSRGDIHKFLRVLAASFSSHAEQREIYFHIRIPESSQPALFDHDKLEKIVYNLLSNAFKFTTNKGGVSLTTSINNYMLEIKVSDTGKGIPSDRMEHIFDRFYQADDTLTREQGGTGIGLSLTKELISLMNGDITVNSKVGEGSTFIVHLPIELKDVSDLEIPVYDTTYLPPVSIDAEKQELPDGSPGHSRKNLDTFITLVVEDNADMRHFIREQLRVDYKILEASDGDEGWKKAISEVPDLVITDLMMPKMDGMELCRKLKTDERTSHIPVIMLTAKAGQEHKIEGLETGADSYLTKPFDLQELQIRVKNLINQRQLLREKYSKTVFLEPRHIVVSSLDEQFLQKVNNLLEDHHPDAGFGVPQMQEALAMSKTQLHRKMKALTGYPPGEFLRNYRLKRAAQILVQKGDIVTQAAYAVGFNNLSWFSKCFRELYGVAPSEYIDTVKS